MATSQNLPPFHPQTVIRKWGENDAFRLSDAQTGVVIFGATGSGKTSGPARSIAHGYLANQFGGLVLCAKKEESRMWQEMAKNCGRSDDLIIIDKSGKWRFNVLDWEASRPEEGGGLSINIVNLLDEIASSISGGSGPASGGREGSDKFWTEALHFLNCNVVDLALLAQLNISLSVLQSIVTSAPYSEVQANNADWRKSSFCAQAIEEADKLTAKADEHVRADYMECRNYFLSEFPKLAEKTRSIITLTFSMLARPLITRPLRKLFSSDTNVKPEHTFDGKIIIVDLPVQEFRLVGRIANLVWKYCLQIAVLRRMQPTQPGKFLRPVFLWADECQNFITNFDAEYQAVARSAGGCSVYLVQNRESLRRVLKNNDAVDSWLGNMQCKFFCQGTGETNEWAAKLLGERWMHVTSTNVGQGRNDDPEAGQGTHSSGVTRSEQRRYWVEPSMFTTLKRGGALHGFQVEAIVYNGGNMFAAGPPGKETFLPYKLLTFNQRE